MEELLRPLNRLLHQGQQGLTMVTLVQEVQALAQGVVVVVAVVHPLPQASGMTDTREPAAVEARGTLQEPAGA